jgi:hypothetical protein
MVAPRLPGRAAEHQPCRRIHSGRTLKKRKSKAKSRAVPEQVPEPPKHDRLWRHGSTIALLALGAFLLFFRLGHYALWDDESMVALVGSNVWKTGDTGIEVGHNIVAYREGALLSGTHDRSTPPLSTYVVAPMIGLFGGGTFALRFPFALFGWGVLAFVAWWLWKERPPGSLQPVLVVALLTNVSMLLFFRQCRYYAPATFFTVVSVGLYARWRGDSKLALGLAASIVGLFASNYMNCLVLVSCLLLDFLLWRRRELRPSWKALLALILPAGLACVAIASVWNPFRTTFGAEVTTNTLGERATLLWWYLRDLNRAELCVLLLVPVALCIGLVSRRPWMTRGSVAFFTYLLLVTIVSPQPVYKTVVADIRYLAPIIPLGCLLGAGVIDAALGRRRWLAVLAAAAVFGSNVMNDGLWARKGVEYTFGKFTMELLRPPSDPYTAAAAWVNQNVEDNASVWVVPRHMAYPLMYHAPRAIYAWQLDDPPPEQFKGLPDIHVRGRITPDYILAFGPGIMEVITTFRKSPELQARYQGAAVIDHFWMDVHRPELFWHSFQEVREFNRKSEAIYVYRRVQ